MSKATKAVKPVAKKAPKKVDAPIYDDSKLKDKEYPYKVEQNIALSALRSVRMDLKFPFPLMNVGDSFLIPTTDPACKNSGALHYASKQYAKFKPGFMITSRMLLDGTRRVWRIK